MFRRVRGSVRIAGLRYLGPATPATLQLRWQSLLHCLIKEG
jgi:hypothetical protein